MVVPNFIMEVIRVFINVILFETFDKDSRILVKKLFVVEVEDNFEDIFQVIMFIYYLMNVAVEDSGETDVLRVVYSIVDIIY